MREAGRFARDISYASGATTRAGRGVIRSIENLTGRIGLIRMAEGYEREVSAGRDFWEVMVERYGIGLNILGGSLDNIPKTGPIVVVSNHPYGILDGLVLGYILSKTRGDFRILAHNVFRKAEDLNKVILPIDFDETREAVQKNLETRKEALRYLADGGCIGIFPGGTVSTASKPFGRAMDPYWRRFTGRLILKSKATVVPIYFDGANSRMFQLVSHLHSTLRWALLINEFKRVVGTRAPIVVGDPLPEGEINHYRTDPAGLMDYLREQTYRLSPEPIDDIGYGFDFEPLNLRA